MVKPIKVILFSPNLLDNAPGMWYPSVNKNRVDFYSTMLLFATQ